MGVCNILVEYMLVAYLQNKVNFSNSVLYLCFNFSKAVDNVERASSTRFIVCIIIETLKRVFDIDDGSVKFC